MLFNFTLKSKKIIFLLIFQLSACHTAYKQTYVANLPIKIKYQQNISITASEETKQLFLILLLPCEYPNRQKILQKDFSIAPTRIFNDGLHTYAEFDVKEPSNMMISIEYILELSKHDWGTINYTNFVADTISKQERQEYLSAERYLDVNDEEMRKVALSLKQTTDIETVKSIYEYVKENMI